MQRELDELEAAYFRLQSNYNQSVLDGADKLAVGIRERNIEMENRLYEVGRARDKWMILACAVWLIAIGQLAWMLWEAWA